MQREPWEDFNVPGFIDQVSARWDRRLYREELFPMQQLGLEVEETMC